MNETNYCASLIATVSRTWAPGGTSASNAAAAICAEVNNSQKFRLPIDGRVLRIFESGWVSDDIIKRYIQKFRLPYPAISLEFGTSSPSVSAVVILLKEQLDKATNGVQILVCCSTRARDNGDWSTPLHGISIRESGETGVFSIETGAILSRDDREVSDDDFMQVCFTVLEFMAVLQCRNVKDVTVGAPVKLNKKRVLRGKQPFFSYHTLVINDNTSGHIDTSSSGTHASPRVHLRRGHIRVLATHTIWVNACVVGNKSIGMVHKDYRVASGSAA